MKDSQLDRKGATEKKANANPSSWSMIKVLDFQKAIDLIVTFILKLLQIITVVILLVIALSGLGILIASAVNFVIYSFFFIINSFNQNDVAQSILSEEEVARQLKFVFFALELLLLAPLGYLILRSLASYSTDLMIRDAGINQNSNDQRYVDDSTDKMLPPGKESLLETKGLIVGLLFGIIATHVVGDVITHGESATATLVGHGESHGASNSSISARDYFKMGLLVVLAVIYIAIEWLGHTMKRPIKEEISPKEESSSI